MIVATVVLWGVFAFYWSDLLRIDRRGLTGCSAVAAANTISLYCYYWALTRIDASVGHMTFSLFLYRTLLD